MTPPGFPRPLSLLNGGASLLRLTASSSARTAAQPSANSGAETPEAGRLRGASIPKHLRHDWWLCEIRDNLTILVIARYSMKSYPRARILAALPANGIRDFCR
jgi:hypothetical protein